LNASPTPLPESLSQWERGRGEALK